MLMQQDEDEPTTQALDEDDVIIMRTYGREAQCRVAEFSLSTTRPHWRRWPLCRANQDCRATKLTQ